MVNSHYPRNDTAGPLFRLAMKITVSIGIVSVIALSLLAARVEAQIDSNTRVMLRCSPVCAGCNLRVSHFIFFQPNDSIISYDNRSLCVDCDSSFRYTDSAVAFYSGTQIRFAIDTIAKLFRDLTLTKQQYYIWDQSLQAGGVDAINIRFNPLSYIDSSGRFVARGVFQCGYVFSTFVSGGMGHSIFSGNCADSGLTLDTISIEVTPSAYLSVAQAANHLVTLPFHIFVDDKEVALSSSFGSSGTARTIRICDLLGRTVSTLLVPQNAESLQEPLSLPPGCYFARLGNQVAKFVVPPR